MTKTFLLTIPLFALLTMSCGDFPKDAKHTLKNAENKILRVGISGYDSASKVSTNVIDHEIELVNLFAKEIHAEVSWVKGSQTNVIELLHNFELDMAIGGYTSPSPLEKEVAFTQPYKSETVKIGSPPNETIPDKINGQKVWVDNLLAASYVKKKGGIPVLTDSLRNNKGLLATTEQALIKVGAQVSDITLKKQEHVFAVPKGENAFLMKLEKFINKHDKSR